MIIFCGSPMSPTYCQQRGTKYFYLKSGKILSDKDLSNVLEILEVYHVPEHLTNVLIVVQTLNSANNNLVFKGQDSKGRWQYFYGNKHVNDRSQSRLSIIKKVKVVWKSLSENVELLLQDDIGSMNLQIGLIMFLLMRVFIRTGKRIHYNDTNSQGLITMKVENITVIGSKDNSVLRVKFIGKDSVSHDIKLSVTNEIATKFREQIDWVSKTSTQFIFSFERNGELINMKEHIIYDYLSKYNIHPKDVRTYGSNMAFISSFLSLIKPKLDDDLSLKEFNKIVSEAVDMAATRIGHTKNVSKRSYIATQIFSYIDTLYEEVYKKRNITMKKKLLAIKDEYEFITMFTD